MIWAGIVFLQKVTNKSEKEIRMLPYPKFKAMIEYHGDPEAFLKGGITEKEYMATIEEATNQNLEMMRKAKKRQEELERKKELN
jgi:hypothetical protein